VATLLTGAFPSTGQWCNSSLAQAACSWPGFAIGFGGDAALAPALVAAASLIVGGGSGQLGPVPPTEAAAPFFTDLDMAPVFDQTPSGSARVCALRGTYTDARWLAVYSDTLGQRALDAIDIMMRSRYLTDADAVGRTPFTGSPVCTRFAPAAAVSARFVGLSGRVALLHVFDATAANRFTLGAPFAPGVPTSTSGSASDVTVADGSATALTFDTGAAGSATSRGSSAAISSSSLSVTLQRPTGGLGPVTFTGSWAVVTSAGTVTGTASGEALLIGNSWQLRGHGVFTGGTWNVAGGEGGFSAQLATNTAGTSADDAITWQVDGIVAG